MKQKPKKTILPNRAKAVIDLLMQIGPEPQSMKSFTLKIGSRTLDRITYLLRRAKLINTSTGYPGGIYRGAGVKTEPTVGDVLEALGDVDPEDLNREPQNFSEQVEKDLLKWLYSYEIPVKMRPVDVLNQRRKKKEEETDAW